MRDVVVASDPAGRERLWRLRERHTEAVNAQGVPHKLDVAVPDARLAAYVTEVREAIRGVAPDASVYLYGHVGDGNLHVNVVGPPPDDEAVDAAILGLAIAMDGTISAEHGIGVAKVDWLERDRGAPTWRPCAPSSRRAGPDLDAEPRRPAPCLGQEDQLQPGDEQHQRQAAPQPGSGQALAAQFGADEAAGRNRRQPDRCALGMLPTDDSCRPTLRWSWRG